MNDVTMKDVFIMICVLAPLTLVLSLAICLSVASVAMKFIP